MGRPPPPGQGTLTPFIPFSPRIGVRGRLRAFKGEGERRTEAHVGALHPRGPLVQYWGGGRGWIPDPSRGMTGEKVVAGYGGTRRVGNAWVAPRPRATTRDCPYGGGAPLSTPGFNRFLPTRPVLIGLEGSAKPYVDLISRA